MTEESLSKLPIDDLFELMVKAINELVILQKSLDYKLIEDKRKEVELIQRVIVAKRADEPPLK